MIGSVTLALSARRSLHSEPAHKHKKRAKCPSTTKCETRLQRSKELFRLPRTSSREMARSFAEWTPQRPLGFVPVRRDGPALSNAPAK